jgi:hypothetical protein
MAITIGLISEKAWKRGSPGATSYTAERLFGPKYYGDDEANASRGNREFRFLVAVRLDAVGRVRALNDIPVPRRCADLFT